MLDVIHQSESDLRIAASEMRSLANAFAATGNATVAKRLYNHACELERIAAEILDAAHKHIDKDLVWVEQHSRTTLEIALILTDPNRKGATK
jgi:hypothetical protein